MALFCGSSPSAILWGVSFIVIHAINGRASRSWSHICEKIRKGISPAGAHPNSTAAIIFVVRCPWIVATLNHPSPGDVFAGRAISRCMAMYDAKAAAAIYGGSNIGAPDHFKLPTITKAQPKNTTSMFSTGGPLGSEASETLAGNIFKSGGHACASIPTIGAVWNFCGESHV